MAIEYVVTQDFGDHHKGDVLQEADAASAHCVVACAKPEAEADPLSDRQPHVASEPEIHA